MLAFRVNLKKEVAANKFVPISGREQLRFYICGDLLSERAQYRNTSSQNNSANLPPV